MFAWAFWVAGMVHHVGHVNIHDSSITSEVSFGFEKQYSLSFDWQLQARPLYMCAIYVVITDVRCKRSSMQPFCNREEINKM